VGGFFHISNTLLTKVTKLIQALMKFSSIEKYLSLQIANIFATLAELLLQTTLHNFL